MFRHKPGHPDCDAASGACQRSRSFIRSCGGRCLNIDLTRSFGICWKDRFPAGRSHPAAVKQAVVDAERAERLSHHEIH
jgi:hypothetical protein